MKLRGAAACCLLTAARAHDDGSGKNRQNYQRMTKSNKSTKSSKSSEDNGSKNPPNVFIFLVDDMGYNQVGYHAERVGNKEIQTPSIDAAAKSGIIMDRGYMTPWCAPSRSSLQTGRTNSFNANVSNDLWAFDDSLGEGFVGGMPPGTVTIAKALKDYASYKTSYCGKWGIGGTAWTNTPMGMGYDDFLGFFGDSIETCDAWAAFTADPQASVTEPGILVNSVPGFWQQSNSTSENVVCPYLKTQTDKLTAEEIDIACKSTPKAPSKIMDLDLLDKTLSVIKNHDYSAGPLFHIHAPQLMHLPVQYPKAYDDPDHARKEKTSPNNDDLRIGTNNAIRFIDDIFGNITQAIKDVGQWDNTILLFSSDNGGAIYQNTVNNNYPLRGSKFNSFDGGLRVPQFLTGGWIDQEIKEKDRTSATSSTYMFANDWAPTLLEMVGANKEYLNGKKEGASYGNEMWKYIKNSVTNGKESQMERYVSYSLDLYFSIKEHTAHKMFWTGDKGVFVPRHWAAVWPKKSDLVPDWGYQSIQPCRAAANKPYDCCYFELESDPGENYPLRVNCTEQLDIANMLYDNDEICKEFPSICFESDDITYVEDSNDLSIWSHYGAAGPLASSGGTPIGVDLGMKCICDGFGLTSSTKQTDLKSMTPSKFAPYLCNDVTPEKLGALSDVSISCVGDLVRVPQGGLLEAYESRGIPRSLMEQLMQNPPALVTPEINQLVDIYSRRTGFIEWPKYSKFPFVAAHLDSCPQKQATITPLPVESNTPWIGYSPFGSPTNPSAKTNMCSIPWTPTTAWCASKTNPLQKFITHWEYNRSDPKGFYVGGGLFEPIVADSTFGFNISEACDALCNSNALGTAFVVPVNQSNWGLAV